MNMCLMHSRAGQGLHVLEDTVQNFMQDSELIRQTRLCRKRRFGGFYHVLSWTHCRSQDAVDLMQMGDCLYA